MFIEMEKINGGTLESLIRTIKEEKLSKSDSTKSLKKTTLN